MGLAGHCVRHPELVASNLILWEPKHGIRNRGRPATTYIDTLRRDTGLSNTGEIRALMINSDLWRAAIRDSRVGVGWELPYPDSFGISARSAPKYGVIVTWHFVYTIN